MRRRSVGLYVFAICQGRAAEEESHDERRFKRWITFPSTEVVVKSIPMFHYDTVNAVRI